MNTHEHRALAGVFLTACLFLTGALALARAEKQGEALMRCVQSGESVARCQHIAMGR